MKIEAVLIPDCVREAGLKGSVFDVQIEHGRVAAITSCVPGTQAQGTLLPGLVDLHLHLDKSYTVHETGPANGDLFRAIDMIAKNRTTWTAKGLEQRMSRALQEAFQSGTRALRTHLDWMSLARPVSINVFTDLREQWQGRMEMQWVSLTALEIFDDRAEGESIATQVKQAQGILGCFVYRHPNARLRLQGVFELARQYDLDLDFHVDEGLDADATALQDIAELTLAFGWQHRVTCGHACSLSIQPKAQALSTLELASKAGISLVALPTTNLYLQGSWDSTPVQRGITRLMEARQAGVGVSLANDNVADPFYPYGSYDLMDTWALGVQLAHLVPAQDWLDTITTAPAKAMELSWNGRLAPGCPADLILLEAKDGLALMAPAGRKRRICRNGIWL
jgi:cytosine/creatinine deaminase